ncbi:quinolinate synthetase a [Plasmopara halstedii]|uniref:Quinolinate synthase, chloroplastic n=1 Tax=Plasmopara halstedii TaxID=4781 RepID=A0A0P1B3Y3_PLAHL|nr:quinolinate synthetase a [Plasmopara halstedii]CEG49191.1 quinolinate synthetase a [Plasmopara halstedii]|eukprot:XP_024585560.1 quinolinate synthetase a [Plasmopara halstedii]
MLVGRLVARRIRNSAKQFARSHFTPAASASLSASWDRPFPSILVSNNGVSAQGSFAEAQANYLQPDMEVVNKLDALLHDKKMGIVAHFYMDPELQGVLSSLSWPHTFIADSLAMGEAAAKMAKNGIQSVAVLGVDFMSESVRANLDSNGFEHIPVYRLAEQKIGCSLAESAEKKAYLAYLQKAAKTPNSLHIVYINTSLRSKAFAHDLVPTITCTSSNVVQTVLQAFAQVPDINVWYGPDTYMGENLQLMFEHIAQLPDEKIRQIHSQHNQKSVNNLLKRFDYFKEGNCVVHHMFGDKVTQRVRDEYGHAYQTAHFEVPGEMFALAMEAQNAGRGVVGSTSNILNFIKAKTAEAVRNQTGEKLSFVLGTEAGMITAIVRGVQETLSSKQGGVKPVVEIIFPVSADAITTEGEELVPGVAGGEGCSTAGGCATCPFMKMNDIDALFRVVEGVSDEACNLDPMANFYPQKYSELIRGKTVTKVGVQPILHMKAFMESQRLSDMLVQDIQTRTPGSGCQIP